jgi:lipopolysaccharide/colanic/teichoic acid biosynthesis glycosyltransferase
MEASVVNAQAKKQLNLPIRVRIGSGLHHPLSEERFEAHLCHERMRAERSGRTIALLLVDCRKCFTPEEEKESCARILSTLCESTRLTDIVGWFNDLAIAGVIFTEFGKCDPIEAVASIQTKIVSTLNRLWRPDQQDMPDVKMQFFPEDSIPGEHVPKVDLTFYPELDIQNAQTQSRARLKRGLDLIGSSLAILFLFPVFTAVAAIIRLSSPGPALYRQNRVGQFGIDFTMYKFRTMEWNAETGIHEQFVKQYIGGRTNPEENAGIYKLCRDPRVTRLGKFLRRTSLDELPQFLNVLQGSMSLVGPRPPLRYELDVYEPWHRRRILDSKPGLTGLWQVNGRNRTRFDEMVHLDLRYGKTQSLLLDLSLLIKTVRVLISEDSAC